MTVIIALPGGQMSHYKLSSVPKGHVSTLLWVVLYLLPPDIAPNVLQTLTQLIPISKPRHFLPWAKLVCSRNVKKMLLLMWFLTTFCSPLRAGYLNIFQTNSQALIWRIPSSMFHMPSRVHVCTCNVSNNIDSWEHKWPFMNCSGRYL